MNPSFDFSVQNKDLKAIEGTSLHIESSKDGCTIVANVQEGTGIYIYRHDVFEVSSLLSQMHVLADHFISDFNCSITEGEDPLAEACEDIENFEEESYFHARDSAYCVPANLSDRFHDIPTDLSSPAMSDEVNICLIDEEEAFMVNGKLEYMHMEIKQDDIPNLVCALLNGIMKEAA